MIGVFQPPAEAELADRAVDVQVTTAAAVPADPLRWESRVAAPQGSEAQVVAAPPKYGMATRQLAAHAMSGADLLGVQPFPERDGTAVQSISNHYAVNVEQACNSGKADWACVGI